MSPVAGLVRILRSRRLTDTECTMVRTIEFVEITLLLSRDYTTVVYLRFPIASIYSLRSETSEKALRAIHERRDAGAINFSVLSSSLSSSFLMCALRRHNRA
jgi:hypothetical protein